MSEEEDNAESALVAELRALAGAPEGDRFVVSRRGHSIKVTHNSGSSSSLTLRASYDAVARAVAAANTNEGSYRASPASQALVAPRPLAIVLQKDAPSGIRTAYETGDRRFDEAVFVDTTTNPRVLGAVLGPEVRAAVLTLFELGFLRVKIDDHCFLDGPDVVEAYLWSFVCATPQRERAAQCLDAFASILDHLPTIASSDEKPALPKPAVWVSVSGWLGLMGVLAAAPASWFVAKETRCTDDGDCAAPAVALLAAIVVGLIASRVARSTLREQLGMPQSGAFLRVGFARIKVFCGAATLVFFAVLLGFLVARAT